MTEEEERRAWERLAPKLARILKALDEARTEEAARGDTSRTQ